MTDTVTNAVEAVPARALYPVRETARILGISRAQLYRILPKLEARKLGSRTLITRESIADYIASLPRIASKAA
jgi:DNA invertase Pin-like site-specific DNA recombinase